MTRKLLAQSAFALALLALATPNATGAEPTKKPNVLFIFADDQSYETIAAHGDLDIDTPNLDRLVQEGASFSKAYNMGSWTGAVCVASRTCLNTGAFLWRAQDAITEVAAARRKSWSQLVADVGYDTYMAGKWHVKEVETSKVFHHSGTIRPGMPKATKRSYNRPKNQAQYDDGWKPWDRQEGGFWEGGTHWSEVLANEGVEFLKQ
ncbi:MAG: sulfatase-like hydrolase/transferase, partial [Verrucomicrobiales bacterium]